MPERTLLCLKRNVDEQGQLAFGKEFIATLRERSLPKIEGREGAFFCIHWGQVGVDSDGPVEWCWPVPDAEANALAERYPELTLRTEPAHFQLAAESLRAWEQEQPHRHATAAGPRELPSRAGSACPAVGADVVAQWDEDLTQMVYEVRGGVGLVAAGAVKAGHGRFLSVLVVPGVGGGLRGWCRWRAQACRDRGDDRVPQVDVQRRGLADQEFPEPGGGLGDPGLPVILGGGRTPGAGQEPVGRDRAT
jgi:hypothetical protein